MKKLILLVFIFVLVACVNKKQQIKEKIKNAESEMFSDTTGSVDYGKADGVVALYRDFVNSFPDDSAAPGIMFKEAEVLMSIDKAEESIAVLDSLIKAYPESDLVPQAMHLKGFIYDDKLHNVQMAKISFNELIKKFPDNELAKNAADYIKILGKTPEEIIREFEKKNSTDTLLID